MPQGVGWRGWALSLSAEALGSALLVALGCASLLPGHSLTEPAFAFGGAVAWLVQATAPASGGYLNPAPTLAALLIGRLDVARAVAYMVAQCVGGVLGFGALVALGVLSDTQGCTTPAIHPVTAAFVEALLTGSLVALCLALWSQHDDERPDHAAPLKLGLTVAGLVYSGGRLTGASLNPARSLGPAIVLNYWHHHWVYWVGPLGGAAIAALIFRAGALLSPVAATQPRVAMTRDPVGAETLPLADKRGPC